VNIVADKLQGMTECTQQNSALMRKKVKDAAKSCLSEGSVALNSGWAEF